jgi:hypothetical protein
VSRDHFPPDPSTAPWEFARASATPNDCFADEVNIDFPAVEHLLERVRDAFLNEPAGRETLTAEIQLSGRDAAIGTVVPFEVPLRTACPECGGRGETWTEPCAACRGTGDALIRHPVTLSIPAGVAHGSRFRFRIKAADSAPVRVEVRVRIRENFGL